MDRGDQIIQAAIDIFQPVMELSIVFAAKYANACNRNTVTIDDARYGMRHAAMTCVGKNSGSLFPEVYGDGTSDSESSEWETDSDGEVDDFCRYTGDDQEILDINRTYDEWDSWVPENPAEIMIKKAIDAKG